MKVVIDMNLSPRWVEFLEDRGVVGKLIWNATRC